MRRRPQALTALALMLGLAGCGSTVQLGAGHSSTANQLSGDGLGLDGGLNPAPTGTADGAGVTPGTNPATTGPDSIASQTPTSTDPTGASTPSSSGSTTGPASVSAIPEKGFGWNKSTVYIGIPTQKAAGSAINALGIKGFATIDHERVAAAIVRDINKSGGLFGRGLNTVAVDNPPLPNQTGQAQCAKYTEDNQVFAVADAWYDTATIYGCLAKANVPFVNALTQPSTQKTIDQYSPYMFKMNSVVAERLVPVWVKRMEANNYFQRWNAITGKPGTSAVKVGILCTASAGTGTKDSCLLLDKEIKRLGYPTNIQYVEGSDTGQSAVLAFKASGVTHVMTEAAVLTFFTNNAEQQAYRPRYATTSNIGLSLLLASNGNKNQVVNTMAVGFLPYIDVTNPPSTGRGHDRCMKALKAADIDYREPVQIHQAQSLCDAIYFFTDAAKLGGGFSPEAINRGRALISKVWQPGNTFVNGLGATRRDDVGAVRDIAWSTQCSCFKYLNSTNYRL